MRSTTPGTVSITFRMSSALLRSVTRSGPNNLIAICARVPDSKWSIRCDMGCPTSEVIPGIWERFCRTSSIIAACGRSSCFVTTSISLALTPAACSSNSARPVLRVVETTSGVRCSHRRDISESQRRKHTAFETAEVEQWNEHEHDDQGGKNDRASNLARRLEDD